MFQSAIVSTRKVAFRTLNGDPGPLYGYNGILDIYGYRGHGMYGDGIDQATAPGLTCNSTFGTNGTCCGQTCDSYGNCTDNSCTYYYISVSEISSSLISNQPLRNRDASAGYVITSSEGRYYGFKSIAAGGLTGPSGANPCNAGCAGGNPSMESYYRAYGSMGNGFVIGVRFDGSLWAWGYNLYGQLGDGTTTNRSSPVQIGTGKDWEKVSAGNYSAYAIKNNGELWTWGYNGQGQLGDGTVTNRSSPVQVSGGGTWKSVAAGETYVLAIKSDGSLFSWGANNYGQLGDGTTTDRSSPTAVGSLTDWKTPYAGVFYSLGLKTDGTLWAWGYNAYGNLGDNTLTNQSSPVLVLGGYTDWIDASVGNSYATYGLRASGFGLWGWGTGLVAKASGVYGSPVSLGSQAHRILQKGYTRGDYLYYITNAGRLWVYTNTSATISAVYTGKGRGTQLWNEMYFTKNGTAHFLLKNGNY
jgi:hypothetical protein